MWMRRVADWIWRAAIAWELAVFTELNIEPQQVLNSGSRRSGTPIPGADPSWAFLQSGCILSRQQYVRQQLIYAGKLQYLLYAGKTGAACPRVSAVFTLYCHRGAQLTDGRTHFTISPPCVHLKYIQETYTTHMWPTRSSRNIYAWKKINVLFQRQRYNLKHRMSSRSEWILKLFCENISLW